MPKEVHEIKQFITGTITSADVRDIPNDSASFSLNVEPIAEDGKVRGIPNDSVLVPYQESVYDGQGNTLLIGDYPSGQNVDVLNRAYATSMAIISNDEKRDLLYFDDILKHFVVVKDIYNLNYESDNFINEMTDRTLNSTSQSIQVNSHRAYVGMGQNETPQWVGYIKHSNLLSNVKKGELLSTNATLEEFGESSGQYIVDKWCKAYNGGTANLTSPTLNTYKTQIHLTSANSNFIYGIQKGTKYIYRMCADGSAIVAADDYIDADLSPAANIQRSNIIYNAGETIDDTFVTIATCKSHAGCVWVGGASGSVYKINVADATKDSSQLFNSTDVGGGNIPALDDTSNFLFAEHCHVVSEISIDTGNTDIANGAVLGDIIESGSGFSSKDLKQWNLFVSFYRQDFFTKDDSFVFKAVSWTDSSDGYTDGLGNFIGRKEVVVGNIGLEFKDKSPLIRHVLTKQTRKRKNGGKRKFAYNPDLFDFKNSEGYVKYGPGAYTKGYDKIRYRGSENANFSSWADADDFNTDNYSGQSLSLGNNLGWLDKAEIKIARYGLVDINETRGYDGPIEDGMIGLLASSNSEFVYYGGKLRSKTCGVADKTWVANENYQSSPTPIFMFMLSGTSNNQGIKTPFNIKQGGLSVVGGQYEILHGPTDSSDGTMWIRPFSGKALEINIDDVISISFDEQHAYNTDKLSGSSSVNEANVFFVSVKNEDIINSNNKTFLYGQVLDHESDSYPGSSIASQQKSMFRKSFPNTASQFGGNLSTANELDIGSATILSIYNNDNGYDGLGISSEHKIICTAKTARSVGNGGVQSGFANTDGVNWDSTANGGSDNFADFSNAPSILEFVGKNSNGALTDGAVTTEPEGHFINGDEYRYKIAFEYDNLQLGPLSSNTWIFTGNAGTLSQTDPTVETINMRQKAVDITINLEQLPARVTRIYFFRKDPFDINEPEAGSYSNVFDFGVNVSSGWSYNSTNEVYSRTVRDVGNIGASYESMSQIPETLKKTLPNYELSTRMNDFLFIAKCKIPGETDDFSQYIFKSIGPSNWNAFNWTKDFMVLPSIPTAIASFKGRLIAFDDNTAYVINASGITMEMIDKLEGVGCLSQDSFVATEFGLFVADNSNIYMYDGTRTIPIGSSILDASGDSFAYAWINRDKSVHPKLSFDGFRGCLVVAFNSSYGSPYIWSYQVARKRWDLWEIATMPEGSIKLHNYRLQSGINTTKITIAPEDPAASISDVFENTEIRTFNGDEDYNFSVNSSPGIITNIIKDGKYAKRVNTTVESSNVKTNFFYDEEFLENLPLSFFSNVSEFAQNLVTYGSVENFPFFVNYFASNGISAHYTKKFNVPINLENSHYYNVGDSINTSIGPSDPTAARFSNEATIVDKTDEYIVIEYENLPEFPSYTANVTVTLLGVNTNMIRWSIETELDWTNYYIKVTPTVGPLSWEGNLTEVTTGDYTIHANESCYIQENSTTDLIEISNNPKREPTSLISGFEGELILSDSYRILNYLGGEGRRQWKWHSKDLTFGEDNKFKKIYKAVMSTNIDALKNNRYIEIPQDALISKVNEGSVYANYSIDGNNDAYEFQENGEVLPEHRKSKSIKLKIDSVPIVDSELTSDIDEGANSSSELSSISISYRRLPNTSGNF